MNYDKQAQRVKGGGVAKNKQPNPIQISSEQILREANDRQEVPFKRPKQHIRDQEELNDYRLRKRQEFEGVLKKNRYKISTWLQYAKWEESQFDFERARSIYERVIEVDYRNVLIWIRYSEMEMKHKNVNHARNVLDRAVKLLPRIDSLWLKYAQVEEILGNIEGSRKVFERWMGWMPQQSAWKTYINMERRYKEFSNARDVMRRFVKVHPYIDSYLYWAKFEQRYGSAEQAREVYELASEELGDKCNEPKFFKSFADFEEDNKEVERARGIYKYALDHVTKKQAEMLFKDFISFEKRHGDKDGIEEVITNKRRFEYEEKLQQNSYNYDVWFDYVRLEESFGDIEKTREVYERAISNIPLMEEKRYWRRYIYLWVNYAIFEELLAKDIERARSVYQECLKRIPHDKFSFSKIWIMYAKFEIRQKRMDYARKILGNAIGKCPKDKIFKEYIKIELLLGNVSAVRKLFEKYLEFDASNCEGWKKYAEFEAKLQENTRARGIFEMAVNQPVLDMPELIWKSYIDFELKIKEVEKARKLYERLLEKTKHVKVWISYATMETSPECSNTDNARKIYERANEYFKKGSIEEENSELNELIRKEQRVMLLKSWKAFEEELGDEESITSVSKKMPKRVKRRRKVKIDNDENTVWEEYHDYIFPEENKDGKGTNMKLLQLAYKWKKQKQN